MDESKVRLWTWFRSKVLRLPHTPREPTKTREQSIAETVEKAQTTNIGLEKAVRVAHAITLGEPNFGTRIVVSGYYHAPLYKVEVNLGPCNPTHRELRAIMDTATAENCTVTLTTVRPLNTDYGVRLLVHDPREQGRW